MIHQHSRRRFFSIAASLGSAIFSYSCSKEDKEQGKTNQDDCLDLSNVSREDLAIREKLAYVDESPIPDNTCANCNLFLPSTPEKKCGGCMLFKGPVNPSGHCTYWAPKV